MWETWLPSLGWEDPLGKEMATNSVFWPGKSHGQRSLASYSPWGGKELDTTEQLAYTVHVNCPSVVALLFFLCNVHLFVYLFNDLLSTEPSTRFIL